ncbi:hypothetical protein NX059_002386 [Plenodomus lindquistii]|nr:hypothetical protein NX059_002386 [Plenodomus lindquistii]
MLDDPTKIVTSVLTPVTELATSDGNRPQNKRRQKRLEAVREEEAKSQEQFINESVHDPAAYNPTMYPNAFNAPEFDPSFDPNGYEFDPSLPQAAHPESHNPAPLSRLVPHTKRSFKEYEEASTYPSAANPYKRHKARTSVAETFKDTNASTDRHKSNPKPTTRSKNMRRLTPSYDMESA